MKMLVAVLAVLACLYSGEAKGQVTPTSQQQTVAATFDPVGTYDVFAMIEGEEKKAVMVITKVDGKLQGVLTPEGETEKQLANVKVEGQKLMFSFPDMNPIPIQMTFEGANGKGMWGTPDTGTGAIRATKRSS